MQENVTYSNSAAPFSTSWCCGRGVGGRGGREVGEVEVLRPIRAAERIASPMRAAAAGQTAPATGGQSTAREQSESCWRFVSFLKAAAYATLSIVTAAAFPYLLSAAALKAHAHGEQRPNERDERDLGNGSHGCCAQKPT
mmetsp:Transcript_64282/g.142963  ORF Transcript_64282/g.142963 Transcript_64282/m.142963 type:complete len:140 (+) Transcript_64282:185-604(+)